MADFPFPSWASSSSAEQARAHTRSLSCAAASQATCWRERFPALLEPRHSGLPSFSRGWTGPLGAGERSSTVMNLTCAWGPQKSWRTLQGPGDLSEQVGTGASGIFIVSVLSPHSPPPTPSPTLLVLAAHPPTHLPSQGLYGAQRTPASP